jgi:hypothetical protein
MRRSVTDQSKFNRSCLTLRVHGDDEALHEVEMSFIPPELDEDLRDSCEEDGFLSGAEFRERSLLFRVLAHRVRKSRKGSVI